MKKQAMEAYIFKTKVSENGTIVVPDGFDVKNKEVEVIILNDAVLLLTGSEFVEGRTEVKKNIDVDQARWEYLKAKHAL
ncbi:hypothetical protein [Pedobacter sp. N23S346]|uniref:hypothetical protein n=1 Tax=Pedobacter sp. N23S346 TaxID=3402750 RepID=UPI003AD3F458